MENTPIVINSQEVKFELVGDHYMTDSLTIAKVFGKEHAKVLRSIREKEHLFNAANFGRVEYADQKGEKRPAYLLDRDFFSFIVMGFTGSKADAWKLDYIKAFNMMESALLEKQQHAAPQLPDFTDPVIAARAWADEVEKKLALEQKVAEKEEVIEKKDQLIVAASELSIKAGDVSIGDFAKNLAYEGLGRNNLFAWLKGRGFLRDNTAPYQPYVNRGYFVRKPTEEKYGGKTRYQTFLTPKGALWLAKMLHAEFGEE